MDSHGDALDHRKCFEGQMFKAVENYVLKYLVLVPADITDEQKVSLKASFIEDSMMALEKILLCNVPGKQEKDQEESLKNEI
jgi:hypothetical protein